MQTATFAGISVTRGYNYSGLAQACATSGSASGCTCPNARGHCCRVARYARSKVFVDEPGRRCVREVKSGSNEGRLRELRSGGNQQFRKTGALGSVFFAAHFEGSRLQQ